MVTLREWLDSGPFALSIGQGWGGEFASLGCLRGLITAYGSEAIFRSHVTAVSGSSSGAKIAAMVAQPHLDLEEAAQKMLTLGPGDVFDRDWALRKGGLCGGSALIGIMEQCFGERGFRSIEHLPTSFGTTAFDLDNFKSVALKQGDLARVCQASGSFPLVFAPVTIGGRRFWDFAGVCDPAGVEGLDHDVAFRGNNRLLQIANCDWNVRRWVVQKPSDIGQTHVLSLVIQNHTKVLPFVPPGFSGRAARAYSEAQKAVENALDKPLEPGSEKGHFICVIDPSSSDDYKRRALSSTAAVSAALLGVVALLLGGGF